MELSRPFVRVDQQRGVAWERCACETLAAYEEAMVPLPLPRFWLAALASLGEPIDLEAAVPDYFAATSV